jgi:hypothetical protein
MTVDGTGFLGLDPSIVLGGDRRYIRSNIVNTSDQISSIHPIKYRRYIRSNIFGDMTIEMVLFISNNLHGHGTVVRQVTLPKLRITKALEREEKDCLEHEEKDHLECDEKNRPPGPAPQNLNRGVLQKWLNTMDDTASIVVKDTWVDLLTPHTEGMVLNYLRLKGVLDFTTLYTDSELSMIERCHGGD